MLSQPPSRYNIFCLIFYSSLGNITQLILNHLTIFLIYKAHTVVVHITEKARRNRKSFQCYCTLNIFLSYSSNSATLISRIILRKCSASRFISRLAAAHSSDVAELVCTTSLICSIPSLICCISSV